MFANKPCDKCRDTGWIYYEAMGEDCSSPCDAPMCDAFAKAWIAAHTRDIENLLRERDEHLEHIAVVARRRYNAVLSGRPL